MSRVGKLPVILPKGVKAALKDSTLEIKGPKGTLLRKIPPDISVELQEGKILVHRASDSREHRAFHGLIRNLIANMVHGVTSGFSKILEINGVGYKAQVKGRSVEFNLGYSHSILFPLLEGVEALVEKSIITISGINKEDVGQTAANIRALRRPEPYKGKGIKYQKERIIRKAGKTTK
ncbi:MAG: 50S ribosomal protein L6 [Nitrospirae bacterium CG_4_9_14_3_um_filter_53_35]|nr:MAG: 50S ribosomal protein L6 [Nitrospirae bacterium CG2_30_53_67]PIS37638.1 MAG: 50S ribosomal protein L6 [Nitrospirae bacterium CG08_land_8_20_14_0_20_52_24]PIV82599.1 MAG: 50S ribosomal protein L6 [Nitrospirae bacterium CG17_big_fil_post_rev_8_21_14_2_50_50_9]PIW86014.1 MAG: 50S ribosomal protein L6 [Nitrospirae bacterium CG_4_8_14_3_um_filter_50_41]PIX86882.1 MAG: 50S ribosomal protein L6 [Nitrospirae bacterium CG_4_10_14_3_um_filter_53_41]PJA76367.1 MAG: 50S ribosomal protein L6 [Nitro